MSKLLQKPPVAGPTQRQLRVGEQIRQVVAEFMYRGDFYLSGLSKTIPITVSEVRMSVDLKHAFIFIMPLGGVMQEETIKQLYEIASHIRQYINKNSRLKNSPILHFEIDNSFDEASKIEGILSSPTVAKDLKGNNKD